MVARETDKTIKNKVSRLFQALFKANPTRVANRFILALSFLFQPSLGGHYFRPPYPITIMLTKGPGGIFRDFLLVLVYL
jgi:hypothetical protein